MKHILTICVLVFSTFIFSQNNQLVEIETNDGNIFLGTIIEENEDGYTLKTQDGIQISVPIFSVKNVSEFDSIPATYSLSYEFTKFFIELS